ncbi:MAG: Rrf2 family transcriptional regulator [Oscillospiraceae bacterium]|jgi:Rrf2 family protein|nr:Rrf2 family transcriptional regulator [Oscillospiraceae bacterium]
MRISTKTQHALRMMLDFAVHGNDGYTSLKDVAARMNVSKTYLEQVMIQINKTNFLTAVRGSTGGYRLARALDKCSVGDILRAMEGGVTHMDVPSEGVDGRVNKMAADVWNGLEKVMMDYLDGMTLQDIVDKHRDYLGYDYTI